MLPASPSNHFNPTLHGTNTGDAQASPTAATYVCMVLCASRFPGLVVVPFASATSRSAVIEGGRHEAALLLAGSEEYSLGQTDAMLLTDQASHTDSIANDRSSGSLPSLAPRQDGHRAFLHPSGVCCIMTVRQA